MSKLFGIVFASIFSACLAACSFNYPNTPHHHQKLSMNFDSSQILTTSANSEYSSMSRGPMINQRNTFTSIDYNHSAQMTEDTTPNDIKEILNNVVETRKKKLGLSREESQAFGCNIGDRFDRKAMFAYNFANQQSRLSLHMNLEGPSLSNPTNLQLNSFLVRFTHKFQKPASRQKTLCLYPSSFQGLIGSGYNELFIRNNYTVMDELKDMGLDLR